MAPLRHRRPLQVFRLASLVMPSAIAWEVASLALQRTRLDDAVAHALGPLWLATLGALVLRGVDAYVRRASRPPGVSWLDIVDVLTATGSSMAWTGAAAVVGAVGLGWASLSLVGLFGLCVLHVVALWTLLRAGGSDPWRRDALTRRFVPDRVLEGDAVTEEVSLVAPRIPAGFRLFASGRIGPRWPLSRYAVQAAHSSGELVLESDVGPAVRGAHHAEPLEVWLEDVLGLCHSPHVLVGAAELTVLPRPASVEGARELLHLGGHGEESRTAIRLPTEGSFHLREYQPGDDVRRIHWLRSLTAREIVVRLPDELPSEQPSVRLVLDTFHPALAASDDALTCSAPDDLLDALVRVWLGIGRALVEQGVRVTAVAAVGDEGRVEAVRRALHPRSSSQIQGLGARVGWQCGLAPTDLLTGEPSIVVSHRPPATPGEAGARWVVVPGSLWTTPPARAQRTSSLRLVHPPGSADNRPSRRRGAQAMHRRERADHEAFRLLTAHSQALQTGHLLARPAGPAGIRLEVLP